MTCIEIPNGVICFDNISFTCPYCEKEYEDTDEKYLDRCNKNKCGYTKIRCECGESFGVTYSMRGNMVGFKLD